MPFLSVDIGTTHCKAGVIGENGKLIGLASLPMHRIYSPSGYFSYDPEELLKTVIGAIRIAIYRQEGNELAAIGISSMAESGLLMERADGTIHSPIIPWFDMSSAGQVEKIRQVSDTLERFCKTGIRASYKCSLAKLLWLKDQGIQIGQRLIWLSVADYIVYRLTGEISTDYSLAGRTFAFRIDQKEWDTPWLQEWGLPVNIFPPAWPSGEPIGRLRAYDLIDLGVPTGIPVVVAGHDHICAAFGAGVIEPGPVFDSMGTAESLFGAIKERELGEKEYRSGLSYGCHVINGQMYWVGGLSASGGSLEWLRSILGQPALTYNELDSLQKEMGVEPGDILYFPYLSGSGSPHTDSSVRAAFVGLNSTHNRADLVKAVLEGTAYEIETARLAAEGVSAVKIDRVVAAGGGTRNRQWLQIKADVSNCIYQILPISESTLLGAALLAGIGCGYYASVQEAISAVSRQQPFTIFPDPDRHMIYQHKFSGGYLPLQGPLRAYFNSLENRERS
jgi:sugar (pentulose or hexulose) kinase